MSAGSLIAAEIKAALIEAASATGSGELICALRVTSGAQEVPWQDDFTATAYVDFSGIEYPTVIKDGAGMVVRTDRTLMLDALAGVPKKGSWIAVGTSRVNVTSATVFDRIREVRPMQPGGEVLFYECFLEQ